MRDALLEMCRSYVSYVSYSVRKTIDFNSSFNNPRSDQTQQLYGPSLCLSVGLYYVWSFNIAIIVSMDLREWVLSRICTIDCLV